MIETHRKEGCKGCDGVGVQTNKDGIKITCPVCGGCGYTWRSNYEDLPPGVYCCNGQHCQFISIS